MTAATRLNSVFRPIATNLYRKRRRVHYFALTPKAFSASRMILEPTAASGLSFEINWPISSKSATAGSVQIRVAIIPFRRRIILWAISEQLSQFQQTIQSVAGIIAFGPPVNHPLFCAAVTTQVRIPSRPLVLSKSVSSSKSRRGDQSENEASHMYKVSHSTQCRAHIL